MLAGYYEMTTSGCWPRSGHSRAPLVVLERGSHIPCLEYPEAVAEAVLALLFPMMRAPA